MKLSVELVPRPLWGKSLEQRLKHRVWRKLRAEAIGRTNDRSDACGAGPQERRGRSLHVHEVWTYNDDEHVQTLVGLRPLCGTCSACTHFGRAGAMTAREASIDLDAMREHPARVNGIMREQVQEHIGTAFDQWRIRSAGPTWRQDYGEYFALLSAENLKRTKPHG